MEAPDWGAWWEGDAVAGEERQGTLDDLVQVVSSRNRPPKRSGLQSRNTL